MLEVSITNYQVSDILSIPKTLILLWSQSRGWPYLQPMAYGPWKSLFSFLNTTDHCVKAVVDGGVCVFVKRTLVVINIEIVRNDNNAHIETEIVCVDIMINKGKYRLITVYRPPGCTMIVLNIIQF